MLPRKLSGSARIFLQSLFIAASCRFWSSQVKSLLMHWPTWYALYCTARDDLQLFPGSPRSQRFSRTGADSLRLVTFQSAEDSGYFPLGERSQHFDISLLPFAIRCCVGDWKTCWCGLKCKLITTTSWIIPGPINHVEESAYSDLTHMFNPTNTMASMPSISHHTTLADSSPMCSDADNSWSSWQHRRPYSPHKKRSDQVSPSFQVCSVASWDSLQIKYRTCRASWPLISTVY